jgi:hypothetical protein
MRVAAVAGHASDGWYDSALLILIKAEILFIDLRRHFEHMAGNFFFGLGIAGKIQFVGGAIFGRSMAEVTFHA